MKRPERLEVGFVSRAHGLRGELAVRTHDPESEAIGEISRLCLDEREWKLRGVRRANKEWLVSLEGVEDRTQAEALRGAKVLVFREELTEADEAAGEYFQGDLIGLSAVTVAGEPLGQVEALWETGPVPNLVIRTPNGEELLVPFIEDYVPLVDVEGGRIQVIPLDYKE